jgi:hypothetical protein
MAPRKSKEIEAEIIIKVPPKKKAEKKAVAPVEKVTEKLEEIIPVQKEDTPQKPIDRGTLLIGTTLLIVGIVLIIGQFLRIPLGNYLWPFIFIIPGVLIFYSALIMQSASGEGIAIFGGILTALGALFLVQSITDMWSSWAYAWSLIAPTSVGVSQMIYGSIKKNEGIVETGKRVALVGLTIFVIGFIFFELIIGLNGFGLSRFGLPAIPVALIFIGVFILLRALFFRK